jgi:hypothetical protein
MISRAENRAGVSYPAPNRATRRPARAPVPSDSHQRSDKFERCATRTGGQIVFSDAMSQFNNEVVIRCENPHRLYEFLFFVHFHRDDYEQGGGTTAVPP